MMQTNWGTLFLLPLLAGDALSTSTFATLGSAATITDIIAAIVEGLSLGSGAREGGLFLEEGFQRSRSRTARNFTGDSNSRP